MKTETTVTQEKKPKQYFTRANYIAFAMAALFSVLMIFVAVCIDHSDMGIVSTKNPLAQLASAMGFEPNVGIYGIVSTALFAVYVPIFTVAFVFEKRLAYVNGRKVWSGKMITIYAVTLLVCLALSLGIGLVIQPYTQEGFNFGKNAVNHLQFLGETLLVTLILYVVAALLIGAVLLLIVNVAKPNSTDKALEELFEEEQPEAVADSFDEQPAEDFAKAGNSGFGGFGGGDGSGMGMAGGVAAGMQELEDREKVFPALSHIDEKYDGFVAEKLDSTPVDLKALCEGFRNYLAKYEKLYYDIDTIRMFICGLNATRLILLEGLSGTGKSSLPRYFAKYVQGKVTFLAVQATWRDRTNLLGYFNDFSKTYAETDFLSALYEANYDEDRINLFVLDELNISRVEYYFADFLSVLEYPEDEWKLRVMQLPVGFLPPMKLEEGYVKIPTNSFFVGTANKDDSTFSIADKVYDRSIPIEFDNRNDFFEAEGDSEPITLGMSHLQNLYNEAEADPANQFTAEDLARFSRVTDYIYDEFDVAFGNRVLNQISILVPTYIACGGTKEEVLDFVLARKVLVKLEGRFEDYIKDGLKQVLALLESVYGAGTFAKSEKVIENLMKKL